MRHEVPERCSDGRLWVRIFKENLEQLTASKREAPYVMQDGRCIRKA